MPRDLRTRNGLFTATASDRVTTGQTYNGFGEPATLEARVDATPVLSIRYTRDRLGRIVQKDEAVAGAAESLAYTYDLAGRLARVDRNGVTLSLCEYDGNGNRRLREGPAGSETADYDAQDRLLRYGDTRRSCSPPGNRNHRGNDFGGRHERRYRAP